ncbi:circadian clock-controlled protein daywake isoform X2 [Bicyclus anynana]|uniref:Circadian clock-controlled protein daywake isoform X2 n=1 Tax=Bicyclus anynana TaxID=110368 RepID=A0ABM3LPQ5_BICAN|nr:circadian clock-controlled protein daywake isoform X2 [Bicyclus anynana]
MIFGLCSCENRYASPRLEDLHLDKCRLEDSACMVNAFQKGVATFSKGLPEWGVAAMDVMEFDEPVQIDIAGLSLCFNDGRLKGLENIIIKNIEWDANNHTIYVEYNAPSLVLTGKYLADGQVLLLPIVGDGDMKVKLKNTDVNVLIFLDVYKRSDKTYVSIKNYKYDFNVGLGRYNLTNLFNGDKELGNTVLKLMNDNWQQIALQFARPVMDTVANQIFRNVDRFLAYAPLEDISLSFK